MLSWDRRMGDTYSLSKWKNYVSLETRQNEVSIRNPKISRQFQVSLLENMYELWWVFSKYILHCVRMSISWGESERDRSKHLSWAYQISSVRRGLWTSILMWSVQWIWKSRNHTFSVGGYRVWKSLSSLALLKGEIASQVTLYTV